MFQLSISAAHAYVRKILDELTSVEELGMLVSPDSMDLHKLVEGFIVEAAVRVHTNAPSLLLHGITGKEGEDYMVEPSGKTLTIKLKKDCIRIASIKAKDSDYVVCDLFPEDSAVGRMQLNQYTRGTFDDPRAVLMKKWHGDYRPIVKYYSLKDDYEEPETQSTTGDTTGLISLEYVPYPNVDETIVMICPRLEYAVLNEIAAMTLDSLGEHDKATLYRTKSKESLEGK